MNTTNYTCLIVDNCHKQHCHNCHDSRPTNNEDMINKADNVCLSTEYYRKNKLSRAKIHKCPHCSYETTGPKQTLINHINAKHKSESDKPFYCASCDKGFAQAANYEKHMKRVHDQIVKVTKTREQRKPFVYVIHLGKDIPSSKNTIARVEYYKNNKYIRADNLGKIKYNDNKFLCQSDIHYDNRNNYITFTQYSKLEFIEYSKLIKKLNKESRTNKLSQDNDN